MRAMRVHEMKGIEALTLDEVPTPRPGPDAVRIAVHAAGCNFPDILMVSGTYQVKPELPFIPGMEVAGEIVEIGADVRDLAIGDRVMALLGYGGFAEEVVVPAEDVLRIPDYMDDTAAAGFPLVYMTSYMAFTHRRVALQAGETLLVNGAAGGVGLTAVALGKLLGATVVAAASSEAKLALAKQYGADHLIDYTRESVRDRVRELVGGVDVVFDPVGGDAFRQALRCVNPDARLIIIGFAGGTIQQIPANYLLIKNASAVGFAFGAYRRSDPELVRRSAEALMALATEKRLRAHVSDTFPLAEAAAALAMIRDRKSTGKIVLTMC